MAENDVGGEFETPAQNVVTVVFRVLAAVSPREPSVVLVLDRVLVLTLAQVLAPFDAASPCVLTVARSPGCPSYCSC